MESSMKGRAKRRHLGPSECDDLVQSKTGKESLTQPFNVNLSNTDPNRGLQPRTPTKRSRQASGGVGQQKGITSFISITGVISTSPQKGTKTPVKDEEEEQEPIGHLIPKEENVEEEKIEDYMEGITEDMFDEDFDVGTTSVKKEEELLEVTVRKEEDEEDLVEALPDAHYGLLGVQGGQEEPKGHVQDLPEEVLREVFAHLPADDLYRNISLVCHHWRVVVMDPQFLPWKKLYCRYRKRQNEALKEVKSILDDNQINKKDDLCLLNMLRYMSQFKHSKRVNVKNVLACVKGHQLYAQAEACIKDRIPDMVDNEGPNPWPAMALMLILADGVKDVLDLVALLRKSGCLLTAGGISEYLWAVATLLLAMRENDINVSNRWHYNIFYVLHLMENAPPPAGLQDNRQLITHEQQQILNHDINNNHVVKIMAFAGTGKTTTLVKYAQQRAHMRFLYLAFNKSVAMQAQRSFPYNVKCSTIHSMAFRAVGVRYKNLRKLSNNLQVFDVAWVLPKGLGGFVNAKVVTQTLHNFWASVDQCVGPEHVPHKYKNTHGLPEYPDDHQKMAFSGAAHFSGVENFGLDKIMDLWVLMQPEDKRKNESLLIKDYFIRSFCKDKMGGFRGLKGYAMASEDRELEAKLAVVEKYNKRIPELVKRIYDRAQKSPVCADFILGTVHKAKGLEFDTVVVTDDFMKVPCARHNLQRVGGFNAANVSDDEWNLLYVAITRAKRALYITKTISNILTFTGEYFLRSGLTSTLLSEDPSLVCSIEGCENHITADAVLSMSKLPIRYMESVDAGGVLCLTCVEQRVGPAAFLLSPPERVRSMTYTNERIELPINVAMLLSLL
ncbi:F-box DNA helicase 1-like [Sinocyclocheilus grahami]|uniref:F-box DNA helicase 1-like n=1 Tax=Sinocyclocheilus grahami TaxID=75366 RepID=UPI0007AD0A86|nr:PREDICTED: F-box DNA helicase 1-like [Sinocyclocheilus grahami]